MCTSQWLEQIYVRNPISYYVFKMCLHMSYILLLTIKLAYVWFSQDLWWKQDAKFIIFNFTASIGIYLINQVFNVNGETEVDFDDFN